MRARKKPFPGVQILGSSAKQKGEPKNENETGEREEERDREGGGGVGGEGFIDAFPSALKYVKAWPEANLHIKIL